MEGLNPILPQSRYLYPLLNYTEEDYTAPAYEASKSIFRAHDQPRFGHNDDFGDLLSGESEQQKDYIIGVISGAIIILCVALLWFTVILGLRFSGQKRVGFLSGRLVKHNIEKGAIELEIEEEEPALANDYDDNDVVQRQTDKREVLFNRKVAAVRLVFVTCGMVVLAAGGAFYGKGVVSFRRSFSELHKGIVLVQGTLKLGIILSETILKEKEEMKQGMLETQALAADESLAGNCGFGGDGIQIRETLTNISVAYNELSSMIDDSLANMSDDLRTLVELIENLESSLYVTDIFFYIMIAVTCFLVFLVVAMMIGVGFSAKNVSNCFTRCIARAILWPLFVFFLVLFWTFSAAFLIATLAGADFCISPDEYVAQFMKKFSDLFDGLLLGFVIYYISGCTITAPGTEALFNIATQITVVAESSHNLVEKVGGKSTQDMIDICGLTEKRAEALLRVATMLHSGIHVVDNSLAGLREILACSTLNPIYVTMVHNAVCVESVNGLVCIFSTTLVISVFSMWMILFRAALYPVQEATTTLSPLPKCDSLDLDTDGQVIDKSISE